MEGKASQSGTVSGPAAAKREVRRMIRERVVGLDVAAREAMSRSICRRVSALVRERNFRRVAVFAARPGEVDLFSLLDLLPDREWYFPLVHEGEKAEFSPCMPSRGIGGGQLGHTRTRSGMPGTACGGNGFDRAAWGRIYQGRQEAGVWRRIYDTLLAARLLGCRWRESASPASFWTICPWKPMTGMWTW